MGRVGLVVIGCSLIGACGGGTSRPFPAKPVCVHQSDTPCWICAHKTVPVAQDGWV
jgi:hypothetical protein